MPYKVVVIDDNPLVTRSIVKSIDWEKLNCRVVAEAADGIEGKSVIENSKPHIILTDIRMPGLDGLELARFSRQVLPNSRVILISAYSDFKYTRNAIKLGVFDYVLKPINSDQLFDVVESAIRDLRANSKSPIPESKDTRTIVSKKDVISEIAANGLSEEVESSGLVRALKLHSCFIGSLAFRARARERDVFSHLLQAVEKAGSRFQESVELIYTRIESNHAIFMIHKALKGKWEAKQALDEVCTYIQDHIGLDAKYYFVAKGPIAYSIKDLNPAYKYLNQSLDSLFFTSARTERTPCGNRTGRKELSDIYLYEIDRMSTEIQACSDDEVIRTANSFLDRVSAYAHNNIFLAKSIICEVLFLITRHYMKAACVDSYTGMSVNDIVDKIEGFKDIDEVKAFLPPYIDSLRRERSIGAKPLSNLVQSIIKYVEANYSGDLSLNRIAQEFRVSPAYISTLFRRQMGDSYKDHVIRVRLKHAKRLLKDPTHKVYEVCEMVGFKQYEYFFRVFKKHVGISPIHYRNSIEPLQPEEPALISEAALDRKGQGHPHPTGRARPVGAGQPNRP